jgi:predicted metal-dependent phosphoesterase TrpH
LVIEADLHVHSTASDGLLTPSQVCHEGERRGLKWIALTDHDTTGGLDEAFQAAESLKLQVIPGIELSCYHPHGEIHILGYWVNRRLEAFQHFLASLRRNRRERIENMFHKARNLGYEIEWEEVEAQAGGESIGRPHLARALSRKGYFPDLGVAFDALLAKGRPAYVPREKIDPEEAVKLILSAEGTPVWAHPGFTPDYHQVLPSLVEAGLAGIEVFYPYPVDESALREYFLDQCRRWDLVASGGTDFHGHDLPLGSYGIGEENVRELEKRRGEHLK